MVLYTDNMQVMFAINNNCSGNRVVMEWLRELFWASAVNNFFLVAKRIRSSDNILPDCLSRVVNPVARQACWRLLRQGRYNFRSTFTVEG